MNTVQFSLLARLLILLIRVQLADSAFYWELALELKDLEEELGR